MLVVKPVFTQLNLSSSYEPNYCLNRLIVCLTDFSNYLLLLPKTSYLYSVKSEFLASR